jgi:hypothetical protein
MAVVTIEARPNGPYIVNGASNCATPMGTSCRLRPEPCFVAAVYRRKNPSAMALIRRSGSKLQHRRCLIRRKRANWIQFRSLSSSSRTRGPVGRLGVGTPVLCAANAARNTVHSNRHHRFHRPSGSGG